jgi:hypothetical protein
MIGGDSLLDVYFYGFDLLELPNQANKAWMNVRPKLRLRFDEQAAPGAGHLLESAGTSGLERYRIWEEDMEPD